jgi:Holliday junction resolvase RusA-like endonuclease
VSDLIAELFVPGRPRTKGSLKPFPVRDGRGGMKITVHDTPESEEWKRTMIRAIRQEYKIKPHVVGRKITGFTPEPYAGPVDVTAVFAFDRRQSVNGGAVESQAGEYPTAEVVGDVDKLLRNLLDALTQSGLIADDRFVIWTSAVKLWTVPGSDYATAGVSFVVTPTLGWRAAEPVMPG